MNIVNKMINYRNSRDFNIFGKMQPIDSEILIVIVTEILSWLKLERKRELWIEQGKKTSLKPLELNMNYPWCKSLSGLLAEDNAFSEVFCIDGKILKFKDGISEEYIKESRELADRNYNPPMIIG